MHRIPRIWVMVADRRIMRIFSKKGDSISLLAEVRPQRQEELKMANAGSGRKAFWLHESYKEEAAFTHEIAAWLDAEAGKESFDRLVLAAPPHMLGELRQMMKRPVCTRIIAEIHKDLTKMKEAELRRELGKILWF